MAAKYSLLSPLYAPFQPFSLGELKNHLSCHFHINIWPHKEKDLIDKDHLKIEDGFKKDKQNKDEEPKN